MDGWMDGEKLSVEEVQDGGNRRGVEKIVRTER